jgi:hypothetical protein
MTACYILCSFGNFFEVLVSCHENNLATLLHIHTRTPFFAIKRNVHIIMETKLGPIRHGGIAAFTCVGFGFGKIHIILKNIFAPI